MDTYSVYCDESGHMPTGDQPVMVLGALWCPSTEIRRLSGAMRGIKRAHGLAASMEAKWTKVSPAGFDLYRDMVRLFLDEPHLQFRCIVIREKEKLRHAAYGQDHDTWLYKMYYSMLKVVIKPGAQWRIYLDIKDTRSASKMRGLHDVLCNTIRDFDKSIIARIQTIRSHESELLQLSDILIGAVQSANRSAPKEGAKGRLIEFIRHRTGLSLTSSTWLTEPKFNVFAWTPREE